MFWQRKKTKVMTANELAVALAENQAPLVVDVRSEKDFQGGHVPGAVNIALGELEQRREEFDETKPTVFY